MKIKFLIKIILLFFISFNLLSAERIIFKVNNENYTTIDLKNREIYLKTIKNKLKKTEIFEDFVSVILFDNYAKEIGLNINKNILDEYYSKLNLNNTSNKIDIIKENLLLDIKRKFILEKLLYESNKELNEGSVSSLNIYKFNVKYVVLNDVSKENFNKINNKINFSKFESSIKFFNENKIDFKYYEKEINQIVKINKLIRKKINKKENKFNYLTDEYGLIGTIDWAMKENIGIKLSFWKIKSKINFKKNIIKCENIDQFKNNKDIIIKEFQKIELSKINNLIKNNLKFINDYIKIEDKSYIILCNIEYDKNQLIEKVFNNKVENIVMDIKSEFIKSKKNRYKYIKYE